MCGRLKVCDTSRLDGTPWKIKTNLLCDTCREPLFEWHIRTNDPKMYAANKIIDCERGFTSYACVGDA